MTHWTDAWIGHPYEPYGRGPGYDCLGLFLAVQAAQFGRVLDYGLVCVGDEERAAKERHLPEWRQVDQACEGDAVLMRRGRGWHVGVALNDEIMLHAGDYGSVVEPFRRARWGKRLEGVYRYAG